MTRIQGSDLSNLIHNKAQEGLRQEDSLGCNENLAAGDDMCLLHLCVTCHGKCCVGRTMATAEEREEIIKYSAKDHFRHWKGDLYYLDKGQCPYLRSGLCSVQPVKPFICQIFPFVPRVVDGQFWLYCVGECDAGPKLSPQFIEKAITLAQVFFANRRPEDYMDYWDQNKMGDFDDGRVVFKVKVYGNDQVMSP